MRKNKEELKQYYFVIKQLVDREIKRKYARSFLGVIWSVLNPLMTMAVMSMIFSTIFKRTIENYPIYYLTGTIFWQLFSGATNSAMTALVDNRTLLLKVKLPKQTFVLARIYTALTNFGYTCVAYVLMLVKFYAASKDRQSRSKSARRCYCFRSTYFSVCCSPWESGTCSRSYTCFLRTSNICIRSS